MTKIDGLHAVLAEAEIGPAVGLGRMAGVCARQGERGSDEGR